MFKTDTESVTGLRRDTEKEGAMSLTVETAMELRNKLTVLALAIAALHKNANVIK